MSVQLSRRIRDFTDISLSFKPNPVNGDITLLKNERAIKNALKNCIMIATKSTPFNPNFGSIVHESLFDLDDNFAMEDIRSEVIRSIEFNEPRVEVIEVKVELNQPKTLNSFGNKKLANGNEAKEFYEHYVRVSVEYKIIGYLEVFNTDFILTPTTTP